MIFVLLVELQYKLQLNGIITNRRNKYGFTKTKSRINRTKKI